jgi:hypothetical protein
MMGGNRLVGKFLDTALIYLFLVFVLAFGVYGLYKDRVDYSMALPFSIAKYKQPDLPQGGYPWAIRSIDTQVISKHWKDVSQAAVAEQVRMIKNMGVNYVAVGTPYDRLDDLKLWVDEIHGAGLNVWFRCHWAEWEGDEGMPATMSPQEYLARTRQFIISNPDLFKERDSFTAAVEPEQVGVGLGKRFLTWDSYRNFLLSEISVSSEAFDEIGLGGKIYTNWLSTNGWITENQLDTSLVGQIGLVVVDHFVGQSETIGSFDDPDALVRETLSDLDRYYAKFRKPILLGEWGYQIFQNVPDELQAEVVRKMFEELSKRSYFLGVNYWVHMGNPAAIISDEYGANLKYREAAGVIKSYFDPLNPELEEVPPIVE